MNGRAWEQHEIDKLTTFHIMGLSIQEQADKLGRPFGSIATKRKALGLRYRDEDSADAYLLNDMYEENKMKEPDFEAIFITLLGMTVFGVLAVGAYLNSGAGL